MDNRDLIRDAMLFAVKDITGKVLREATVQSMVDDFEKKLTIPVVSKRSKLLICKNNEQHVVHYCTDTKQKVCMVCGEQ